MFKRRKPEDEKPVRPANPQTSFPPPPSGGPSARPAAAFPPSVPSKETAPMARAPFPPAPSPAAPGAQPPARPGAPQAARKDNTERRTLVVGRGISVQGTIQDAERLVVEGTVESSMIHAAELLVAQGGMFRGEIEVEDADLAGTIDGTLTVRGSLTIRATGRLIGKAKCRRLQVEDGGQVTGQLEMITGASPLPSGLDTAPAPVAAPPELIEPETP
ncbi:bactofilin family protein [Gluconacetobacter tumulisoli]|nr:polymer-forming cytoskeletal protein [Gluconacetobacter tumulisoli]